MTKKPHWSLAPRLVLKEAGTQPAEVHGAPWISWDSKCESPLIPITAWLSNVQTQLAETEL